MKGGRLNRREKFLSYLKVDPDTGTHQVLSQIAILVGIDLAAGIIEVVVFDEGAELGSPIVICTCDHLPREIRVTLPSTGAKAAVRGGNVDARGFRIVNADPTADIRLEPSKGESPYEVRHKRTRVNSAIDAAASY